MNDFKKEVKLWLKRIGKDRKWLGKKTYSAKLTVDGWFSKNGSIPAAKLDLIKGMMEASGQPSLSARKRSDWEAFTIVFTKEEYELLRKCAMMEHLSVQEWCERELIRDARMRLFNSSMARKNLEMKVAEEEPEYGSRNS